MKIGNFPALGTGADSEVKEKKTKHTGATLFFLSVSAQSYGFNKFR